MNSKVRVDGVCFIWRVDFPFRSRINSGRAFFCSQQNEFGSEWEFTIFCHRYLLLGSKISFWNNFYFRLIMIYLQRQVSVEDKVLINDDDLPHKTMCNEERSKNVNIFTLWFLKVVFEAQGYFIFTQPNKLLLVLWGDITLNFSKWFPSANFLAECFFFNVELLKL